MLSRLCHEPVTCYSAAVDSWSLGCVMYECIAGDPPYWSEDDAEQVGLILRPERLQFPQALFGNISQEAIDLLMGLLQPDPMRRLTIEEVRSSTSHETRPTQPRPSRHVLVTTDKRRHESPTGAPSTPATHSSPHLCDPLQTNRRATHHGSMTMPTRRLRSMFVSIREAAGARAECALAFDLAHS